MNGNQNKYDTVMSYSFYCDSALRDSGTNTDMNISTQPITHLSSNGQFICSVTSISIPFSFYQLSATENLNVLPVLLRNPADVAGRNTTITLSPGNYNPYTLIAELNQRLITACQQVGIAGFTPFTPVFTTTYNTTTSYITFSLTAPVGCQISLLFSTTPVTAQLGNFFGVGGVDIIMTTSTTPSSTKPCVLNPVNYLYLRSSLKQYRNREWVVRRNDVSDILHRIPISTSQGTYIQYDVPSEPVYLVDDVIDNMNFYLTTNLSYEPINLQGIDWSFAFIITEVPRPSYTPITERIAYNSFAKITGGDTQLQIDELERQKQREIERLSRYREKLQSMDDGKDSKTPEEAKAPEEKTPEELLKNTSALYPTLSKMKEYESVMYGSVFDSATVRPAGDVLGILLNPTPVVSEDVTA